VHVDNIPTALLSQVEIVTGGASAAYGADALAGVTNFRLNREFTGLKLDVGAGRTDVGDGGQTNFSLAYGTELTDRLHFIGSVERQKIDQIVRDPAELGGWFQRYGIVENPAWTAGDTSQPRRLKLPNVHSTVHTPTGRIARGNDATGAATPFTLNGFNFTNDGAGIKPFVAGDVIGAGTGNQSGGPEADIANRAFNGGPEGQQVLNENYFLGLTFDATDTTRLFMNVLGGTTESNQWNRRGIPHLTNPWYGTIFVDNPYLPANVRNEMIAQGVDSFRLEKQGNVLGQEGDYGNHENAVNRYDGWTLQLGLDMDLGSNWNMAARIQKGETDRYTTVLNESRIDRRFLAIDAVEIYTDSRDVDADGIPDLVAEADRGMGTIICNVQRYNPTPTQLLNSVAGVLVPAPQGDASLGGPEDLVPIPGPIGPDNVVRDCVPMNVLGLGNVSQQAADYVVSQKEGFGNVSQEFAELLFTGDIFDGIGAGPFGMAFGATYREQTFWQYGAPVELMAYGPPQNVPELGIRGISPGYTGGSPNLHEFSTVPVIEGGYDVWEGFAEINMPLFESDSGAQRLEIDLAARYSDYSTSGGINSNKIGINFQVVEALRFRATSSRDVREPTFAERFNLQGGGGSVNDPLNNGDNIEITVTSGGNPDLNPEEADTITAGFVLTPSAAPGFQFSMDYFEIDLAGAVGQLGQQRIVDECFAGQLDLCGLIVRDPTTTRVLNVRNVFLNINSAKVRGIDYELLWNTETDWFSSQSENLSFRFLAGRQLEDSTTVSGGMPLDLSGRYTQPDFTALASVNYRVGAIGIGLQQRYIAESRLDNASLTGPNWIEGIDIDDNSVESQLTTDLTLSYDAELANGRAWQAALSITNVFDTDPPVVASFGQRNSAQNTVPNNFDVYGRRYMMNFRYSF
jgi:outer membrane receptor protein involved in Fe transport